jgi:hypothetical protein
MNCLLVNEGVLSMRSIIRFSFSAMIVGGIALATYNFAEIRADIYDTWPELVQEERNPIDRIRVELGMVGYAVDMLALDYLHEFTDDQDEIWSIASGYWCGTPLLQYFANGGVEPPSTQLRMRAALLLISHRIRKRRSGQDYSQKAIGRADIAFAVECARGLCFKKVRTE